MHIVVIKKKNCIFCTKLSIALDTHGVDRQEFTVAEGDEKSFFDELESLNVEYGTRTYPRVFEVRDGVMESGILRLDIGHGNLIGGYTETLERIIKGELK